MPREVTFFWPREDESPARGIRLSIVTIGIVRWNQYRKRKDEMREFWRKRVGKDTIEFAELSDEEINLFDTSIRWTYLIPVVDKVEITTDGGESWQPGELPAEWLSIEGMAYHVPADLFIPWDTAARLRNPGIFWLDQTESGKPSGGSSANASTMH